MARNKYMIDPALLLGPQSPLSSTHAPSPRLLTHEETGREEGSAMRFHHTSIEEELHGGESGLDYINHFPAPPFKIPRSQQSHETFEHHNIPHWPTPKNPCTDQQQLLHHSLSKASYCLRKPSHQNLVSQLQISTTPLISPLTACGSSSASASGSASLSGSVPASYSNPTVESLQNRPSAQGHLHHSGHSARFPENSSGGRRSISLSYLDHQDTSPDCLHTSFNRDIDGPESSANWTNLQTNIESEPSKPLDPIAFDLDYSFRRLINLSVFKKLLGDPSGRLTFRQAIADGLSPNPNLSLAKLDLWLDCQGIAHLLEILKSCAFGLHDLYLNPTSIHLTEILPDSKINQLANSIRSIQSLHLNPANKSHEIMNHSKFKQGEEFEEEQLAATADDENYLDCHHEGSAAELKSVENYLLRSLYQNEFSLYIKKTLISNVKVRLGRMDLNGVCQDGMGECFCLTNPRLRDHPIVLVSDGFTKVTGHERDTIIGQNCRFLQGPGTSPQSIQRIRDGLNSGEGCTELLLNYRKDGTPFYCLLAIIPFRDITGALIYFIGGQINVTGMLSSKKGLSFLMTDPEAKTLNPSALEGANNLLGLNQYSLSQDMQQYSSRETSLGLEARTILGDIKNKFQDNSTPVQHRAAGSITFDPPVHDKENPSLPKRLFRRFAGINNRDHRVNADFATLDSNPACPINSDQKLAGAEGLFHDPKPLNDQIKNFETVYSQLLIFKRDSRQVIFATKAVTDLFGLSTAQNSRGLFKPKLIQSDFVELIWPFTPHDKSSVAQLRNHLKEIIRCGSTATLDCQIKLIEHKSFFSPNKDTILSDKLKPTKLHLTPLKDKNGCAVAFTCLFGPRDLL